MNKKVMQMFLWMLISLFSVSMVWSAEQNFVKNPGFESDEENWTKWWNGYEIDSEVSKSGKKSMRISNTKGGGAFQLIELNQEKAEPIIISFWTKAKSVKKIIDHADIMMIYSDGTKKGQYIFFTGGTHDWEESGWVLIPSKPVKEIEFKYYLHDVDGTFWFDDISIKYSSKERGKIFNPGFESGYATWFPFSNKLHELDQEVVHSGSYSAKITNLNEGEKNGPYQIILLNQQQPEPFIISGWSKAKDTSMGKGEYCLRVAIFYTDGTGKWGLDIPFTLGTHDWEYAERLYNLDKPVKYIVLYLLFSGNTGTVWFDDISIKFLSKTNGDNPQKIEDCRVLEQDIDGDGDLDITIENNYVKLVFQPSLGATCKKFLYKKTNKNFAGSDINYRLFTDRIKEIGRLWNLPYFYKIEKNNPEEVSVHFWCEGFPGNQFLEMHKTITIFKEKSDVKVDYEIVNKHEAMSPCVVTPYFRHGLGVYDEKNTYYIPTTEGIIKTTDDSGAGDIWYRNMSRSWLATLGESGTGIACEMDYNYLEGSYNWIGGRNQCTLEWWFIPVKIENGKSFKTTYWMMPFSELSSITGIENRVISSIDTADDEVKINLCSTEKKVCKVCLQTMEKEWKEIGVNWVTLFPDKKETISFPLKEKVEVLKCIVIEKDKIISEFERPLIDKYVFKPRERKIAPAEVSSKDLVLSEKVITSHIQWARPYHQGKIKALVIIAVENGREIIELAQRMDLEYQTVRISNSDSLVRWGMSDHYGSYTYADSNRSLANQLKYKYDVIIVSGPLWENIDEKNKETILNQITEGTGLVVITPDMLPASLWSKMPFGQPSDQLIKTISIKGGKWRKTESHFITDGIPFEIFPECSHHKYQAKGKVLIESGSDPILAINDGKTRIVAFAYCSNGGRSRSGFSLTPYFPFGEDVTSYHYWDYYFSLLAKSIIWASHKEPAIKIIRWESTNEKNNYDNLMQSQLVLNLNNTGNPIDVELEISFRDNESNLQSTIKKEIHLDVGEKEIKFLFPQYLRPGINFADMIIRNKEGIINWATATFFVSYPVSIKSIELIKEVYNPSDTVEGKITFTEKADDISVRIMLIDTYERLVGLKSSKLMSEEIPFSFNLNEPITTLARVECNLFKGKYLIDKKSREITITPSKRTWDDYNLNLADHRWAASFKSYLSAPFYKSIHELGFSQLRLYNPPEKVIREYFRQNFEQHHRGELVQQHIAPYYKEVSKMYSQTKDKKYLIRKPCLSDPSYLASVKETIEQTISPFLKYRLQAHFLGDENSLTLWSSEYDFCFSEYCINRFRTWLKEEYVSIDNLNKEWQTEFKEWEDVTPMTTEEVKNRKNNNYAPWADHRTFMETVFSSFYRYSRGICQEIDPNALIGISGTQVANAYDGCDWWKMCQVLPDYLRPYLNKEQGEFMRSFGVKIVVPPSGYGAIGKNVEFSSWQIAFLFRGRGEGFYDAGCILNPDFTLSQSAIDFEKHTRELRNGIGKILINTEEVDQGIRIHYSQPSIHATSIEGNLPKFDSNREGWVKVLEDIGLQYKFISYAQIEQGELINSSCKVLILPFSKAISKKEAEEIKKFVANGGILIADAQAGLMDEHCKLQEKGLLDEIFGFTRVSMKPAGIVDTLEINQNYENANLKDLNFRCLLPDGKLSLLTAKPIGKSKFDPEHIGVLINEYKKGKAIYLNMLLDGYPSLRRTSKKETNILKLIRELISLANIKPEIMLTSEDKEMPYCRIFLYENEGMKYVGILRDHKVSDETKAFSITFPHKSYLYDVRSKRFWGYTDRIEEEISPAEAKFYAMIPYKIDKVNLSLAKSSVNSGDTIEYEIILKAEDRLGDHVVKLEVYKPNGQLYDYYSKNLLVQDGKIKGSFRLALNDPRGQWKIKVIDVISGKTCERNFRVKTNVF